MCNVAGVSSTRSDTLAELRGKPEVSVLIIGGGVNGAGLFRELALQGLDVLLVDKSDFGSGASGASTRMIHGGLRYLEFGEFDLVRESVHERNLLLLNAPHYVFPLPTTFTLFSWLSSVLTPIKTFFKLGGARPARRGGLIVKLGLTIYDFYTRKQRVMPKHRIIGRAKTHAKRPQFHPGIIGTALFYDAWVSYPERLCLELLLDGEAACDDVKSLNYVSVESASGETVTLRDEVSGEEISVKPKTVVNATGAWVDLANKKLGRETKLMGGTKGAHLVLDHPEFLEALKGEMVYYENVDGRVAVTFPWLGKALLGSTDIPIDDPDKARCEDDEVDYMLGALNAVFPNIEIDRSHILSRFSGVRPLPNNDASETVGVSRNHKCDVIEPNDAIGFPVLSMIGGKWTTFRPFGEQVADRLLERLGRDRSASTEGLPIGGGKDFPCGDAAKSEWLGGLGGRHGLDGPRAETLLHRYGARAEEVAAFCAEQEDEPLGGHDTYTSREVEFILREERVVHLEDLLLRRTAIALLGELNAELLDELMSVMARIHGWSDDVAQAERARTLDVLLDKHGIELKG